MAIPISIPRLGWNMEEGVFVGWLKRDGDVIRAGERIFSLESEKATEEIECLDSGILRIMANAPKPGETVAVGTVIGHLVEPGEEVPVLGEPSAPDLGEPGGVSPRSKPETAPSVEILRGLTPPDSPRPISPRARRAANELGVDASTIRGTGRSGRIRERDIRAAGLSESSAISIAPIRKTIAERMVASHRTTAPVTLTTTADATNLVKLRSQFKDAKAEHAPSYTDFLTLLCGEALQRHSLLNARWSDERIILSSAIDIGIAVDTDAGLLVPVIRDVPSLSVMRLASKARDLIERARGGRLSAVEMRGGTFTITNLGTFGIDAFTPIINEPQCAILGLGRIRKLPAVVGDQIIVQDQIALSLTFDHRIVDGAPAARFLQTLVGLIENPKTG